MNCEYDGSSQGSALRVRDGEQRQFDYPSVTTVTQMDTVFQERRVSPYLCLNEADVTWKVYHEQSAWADIPCLRGTIPMSHNLLTGGCDVWLSNSIEYEKTVDSFVLA